MQPVALIRIVLLIVGVVIIVGVGSLFGRTGPLFNRSPFQIAITTPTSVLPTSTSEVTVTICEPNDQTSACLPGKLDSKQSLADPGNGAAQPAVAKDALSAHPARYVNDGRSGPSWVSNSANSWIKIDLGQIRTINMITLEKGDLVDFRDDDLGQFVIAVALSDVYADGDSSEDEREYKPVFHSEQVDLNGTVSHTAMINILFSPVEARFVKIMFEKAGVVIEEVGVFMLDPSMLVEQPTSTPTTAITLTPTPTERWFATRTATSVSDDPPANPPAATVAPSQTPVNTPRPSNTPLPLPSNTPLPLPTNTQPPADTATPVPTDPLPTEVPPTAIEPTATLSTVE